MKWKGLAAMQTLRQDHRDAVRQLRRAPGFSFAVIATLAVGIGLNAAIFTVVDCVLLRPLGYHDADRIVALRTHFLDENRSIHKMGGDDYRDLARQVRGLEATAFYASGDDGLAVHGEALYLPIAAVSPRFGEVMGVEPAAGHLFNSTDQDGTDALVSAEFARGHFGSAQSALGQIITWTGAPRTIIGVLPSGFSFPDKTSVWFEQRATPEIPSRTAYNQRVVGKRRAGVSEQQLASELAAFSAHLAQACPEDRRKAIEAVPLQEQLVGAVSPVLHLLMGSVAVILLIVGANVTHLQLVRATRQLRAVSIRTALGASRASLAGRALLEAWLLAAAGCVAALLLAVPALRLLVGVAPPDTPRLSEIQLNLHVLLFSFAVSLVLMSLTAVFPVWRSWHIDPASALRQDVSRGGEARGTLRLRQGFLVAQVALTLALSVAALLLTRQLIDQFRQALGFAPDHLITLDTHAVLTTPRPVLSSDTAAGHQALEKAWENINQANLARLEASLDAIAAVPGVEAAAAIQGAPMGSGGADVRYAVRGRQVFGSTADELPDADIFPVTPGFFATLRIPLVRGRSIEPGDRAGAPPVVIINQQLARTIFPGQDPLGQQIMSGYDEVPRWLTVIGIVGDVRTNSPAVAPRPSFYVPVAQHRERAPDMELVVRTRVDPALMVDTLRRRLAQTHPEIAVRATTMRENIGQTERADTFRTLLLASFAGVSILLAALGMYGVTAYTVSQRRFEFGLRMAVGATRGQVLSLVLRNGLAVASLGIAAGIGLSVAFTRVLGSVAASLRGFDAPAYALAAFAVLLIAVLATLIPARRAASIDPVHALRME